MSAKPAVISSVVRSEVRILRGDPDVVRNLEDELSPGGVEFLAYLCLTPLA